MDLGAGERPTDGVASVDPHLVGKEGQDLTAQVRALGTDPGLPLSCLKCSGRRCGDYQNGDSDRQRRICLY